MTVQRRAIAAFLASLLALSPVAALAVLAATTASDDTYSTPEDTPLVQAAPGVLVNDTSDDGTLCVRAFDAASLDGSLGDGPAKDGSFTFAPAANFHGETSFTYEVGLLVGEDCGTSVGSATATITVDSGNDAPTAAADSFTAVANRTLNIGPPGVLRNDSDVDGDPVTAVKVENPAHGVVTLAPDGGFSYTPATGFVGSDQFAYRASDGTALSETVVVTLNVAAIPTPVPSAPPATAAPTATPEVSEEPSASPSLEPSASPDPGASPSAPASTGPSASPLPVDPTSSAGGLSIPVIVVGLLLLSLVAFGAAVYVPKWLERQRTGELVEDEAGYLDDEYPDHDAEDDGRTNR